MTTRIEVGEVEISDLEEVSLLFDAYRVFYEKESDVIAAKVFLSDRIKNNESIIYKAVLNSRMVGFTQLYPLFSSTNMKKLWLLNDLYVAPEYRGLKISKMLLDRAKQLAIQTGAVGISLETAKTNDIGNSLYPSAGFEKDEDHAYYFWENNN